ncbi:MAG: hypothetical protein QOD98_1010 [Nocardioidaceae bacterium]|jgi:nucleoside-diphosphate-sugar epimerase|nr:hypothetical protein [Nocardioidaceae bacterium]
MTRIAVTGARGRLGGQVAELLSGRDGVEVVGLTRAMADYGELRLPAGDGRRCAGPARRLSHEAG